jgi:hypothetical protein
VGALAGWALSGKISVMMWRFRASIAGKLDADPWKKMFFNESHKDLNDFKRIYMV